MTVFVYILLYVLFGLYTILSGASILSENMTLLLETPDEDFVPPVTYTSPDWIQEQGTDVDISTVQITTTITTATTPTTSMILPDDMSTEYNYPGFNGTTYANKSNTYHHTNTIDPDSLFSADTDTNQTESYKRDSDPHNVRLNNLTESYNTDSDSHNVQLNNMTKSYKRDSHHAHLDWSKKFHNYRFLHESMKRNARKKQTEFYAWIFGGTMAALALISTSVSCVVFCFCGGERWRYIKRMRVDEQGEYHRVNNIYPPTFPQDLGEAEEGSHPSNSVTVI